MNINSGAQVIYKCRLCGKEYPDTHIPHYMSHFMEWDKGEYWYRCGDRAIHLCEDRGRGIADIIGYMPDIN